MGGARPAARRCGPGAGRPDRRLSVRIAPLASGDDLAAARSLAVLADVAAGSHEQWERDLRSPHRVLLAAHDDHAGRLVGIVTAAVAVDDADLLVLAVDPGVRRRGVGRALVDALCDVLTALGVERLLLEVRGSNRAATALYHATGFQEVARRRSYYRDGEDAVVLARRLVIGT